MGIRRGRVAVRLVASASLLTTALVVTGGGAVVHAEAALVDAPTRLYMAPSGTTFPLLPPYPHAVTVKVGTLEFDDSEDPISNDLRKIEVIADDDPNIACDPVDDPDIGDPDYQLSGCSRVQLHVSHGRLSMGQVDTVYRDDSEGNDNEADPVYFYPGGAILDQFGGCGDCTSEQEVDPNFAGGFMTLHINGTADELNAALDDLVYTPDDDYYYNGSNPETLEVTVVSADPNDSNLIHDVEIRVLDVNDWPELTVPDDPPPIAAGGSHTFPADDGDDEPNDPYEVEDEDNDESTDQDCMPGDDPQTPSCDEGEYIDGANQAALLIMWTTCGSFELRNTSFFDTADGLTELLENQFLPPEVVTAIVAALEAVAPEVSGFELVFPDTEPYAVFAGVTDTLADLNHALSEVTFHAVDPVTMSPLNDVTCEMFTLVSDLGNNGLPVSYIGDPPLGIEIPWIGVDLDWVTLTVGDGTTIDASFDPTSHDVVEGDSVNVPLTITNDPADPGGHPAFDLTVTVTGTASLADLTAPNSASFTLNVPEDATSVSIPVDTFDDVVVDPNETVVLTISPPATPPPGYTIETGAASATVTIIDNDIAVSFAPTGSIAEGASGDVAISVTPPVHPAFELLVTTANVSAAAPGDYTAKTGETVAVAANATTVPVTFQTAADSDPEGDETFTATIDPPTDHPAGYTVRIATGGAESTITIVDDDAPAVSIDDVMVAEGDAGTTNAVFTLTLDVPASVPVSVTATAADNTATDADDDYEPATDVIDFGVGEDTATFTVLVNGDTTPESDETFFVNLTMPVGVSIADNQAVGTITNDDQPAVSIDDVMVVEGDAGTTTAVFTLSLDAPAAEPVSVTATTADNTATDADDDYEPATDVIEFGVGEDTATFTVLVNGDTTPEGDETFFVDLSNPSGLTIADSQGVGTITDDDLPAVSIDDVMVVEGDAGTTNAVFTLSLDTPAVMPVSVTATTADDSATDADDDYEPASSVVDFGVGEDTATFTVVVNGDTDFEPDETFFVNLTAPVGLSITDSQGVGTIDNDDDPPPGSVAVTIDDVAMPEGDAGTADFVFTLTLSAAAAAAVDLDVTLIDQTTTDGDDYVSWVSNPVNVVFGAGETTQTVIVEVQGDTTPEPDETFALLLDNASAGLVLGDLQGIGIIQNDDVPDTTAPAVTINQAAAQADPTSTSPILFTVVFSEPVTGFATGDVTLAGSAGATTASVSGSGTTYTVSVSGMSSSGTVIATIAADVAADGGGNGNEASTSTDNVVTFNMPPVDNTPPTVTINKAAGQADPTSSTPILFTAVFSEPVTGFTSSDVALSGTAGATSAVVSGAGPTYTVTVSGMTSSGTVTATIPANRAVDLAGNPNTASTSSDNTVLYQLPPSGTPLSIQVSANIVRPNDPGEPGAVVTYQAAQASGGVAPITVSCSHASGAFYPIGVTTVSCTATDSAQGQQDVFTEATVSASFTITVNDTEPPTIATPPNLTRSTTGNTPVSVTFTMPSASDNSGVAPTVTCTRPTVSTYPVGVTTVTCTATDGAGNTASSSFTVTVVSSPGSGPATPPGGLPATGAGTTRLLTTGAALLLAGVLLTLGQGRRRAARAHR